MFGWSSAAAAPSLAVEPVEVELVQRLPVRQHLDRDLPLDQCVFGQVHHAHAALPEWLQELVCSEHKPAVLPVQ